MTHPPPILIIDDERDVCDLLRLIFESRGCACVLAHDGIAGLEAARREHPAAILLDIRMPGMNGYEMLVALQADPATRDIPIMIITGITENDRRSDEEWRRVLGVAAFMSKPLDTDELIDRVTALIDKSAASPSKP